MAELAKLPLVLTFTSLNHYITCPKRFYHKYIAKDAVEQKSYAQNHGIVTHNALRRRLKLRERLPEFCAEFEGVCLDIERMPGDRLVETTLAIDAQGRTCEPRSANARFEGTFDVLIRHQGVAFILDWKTGKPWEEPLELRTLALLVKARFHDVKRVVGAFYWIRTKQLGPPHPVIDDTARTWGELLQWSDAIARRVDNKDWPADNGPLCAWCPCSKEQCHHRKDPP